MTLSTKSKKVIFDLEIWLEGESYKHNYNINTPEKGGLHHLLFIKHILEKAIADIVQNDIEPNERDLEI